MENSDKTKVPTIREVIQDPERHSNRLEEQKNDKKTLQQCSDAEIARLKWKWKHIADSIVKNTDPDSEFVIDHTNKHIIDGLFWWFFNDPRSCYDLNKGILLKGDKGTGKTTMVKAFRQFLIEMNQGFAMTTAIKLSLEYAKTGDIDQWTTYKMVCIDEIGREGMGKHYGNELNVIGYILHERYALWKTNKYITIATTNKDADEIEDMYGEVIRDRVKEMFNHIAMVGDSRR